MKVYESKKMRNAHFQEKDAEKKPEIWLFRRIAIFSNLVLVYSTGRRMIFNITNITLYVHGFVLEKEFKMQKFESGNQIHIWKA